jgi:GNAT superfamily N-acetyltransferase
MCDEWMPFVKVPMALEHFHQLPRHAAYKYEYVNGEAWLTPRPRYYHAILDLHPLADTPLPQADPRAVLRPVRLADWEETLPVVFAAAFCNQQPFSAVPKEQARAAAARALTQTRDGHDGPWIEPASFVAVGNQEEHAIGAILVTLLPDADLSEWGAYHWPEPPPPDWLERKLGRPHVTWVFVSPFFTGEGVGTALLNAAAQQLLALGYTELASTILAGNDSSLLWHWRQGFRLLAYPGSQRRERAKREEANHRDTESTEKPN